MPETVSYKTYPYGADNGAFVSHNGSWKTPVTPGSLITNATTAQPESDGESMSGNITLHKIAKTGTYSDLIGTPSIPTSLSDLTDVQTIYPQNGETLRYINNKWHNATPENDTIVDINILLMRTINTDELGIEYVDNWASKNTTQYYLDRSLPFTYNSVVYNDYYLNLESFFNINPRKKLTIFIRNAEVSFTNSIPLVYTNARIGVEFNMDLIILNPPNKDYPYVNSLSSTTDMTDILHTLKDHVCSYTNHMYLKLEIFKTTNNNLPLYVIHLV